jgi:periplasmic divalent cation tolerance protein
MNQPVVAVSTCGNAEEAQKIAFALTEAGLAACVNIVPGITSVYRWKGKVEQAQELLLIVKTRSTLLPALQDKLREMHSYEVPELITFQVTGGLPAYLAWLCEETSAPPRTLP